MKRSIHLLLIIAFIFVSCEKDNPSVPEPTPCPDPPKQLTKTEMLTQKTWQVDEVLRNISGTNTKYIKGGTNTTGTNYNLIRLTFKTDGTGTYTDEVGIVHTTTWKFASTDERNLELVIGPPSAQTFNWNLVEITEKALHNTTAVGTNILVSARYTPVP